MTNEIREFRDGIFALRTRRFGTVAELMIEALYNFTKSHNQFHDRYDEVGHQRIEIKFSTVMKENEAVISRFNSIDQCKKANLGNRALNSTDMYEYDFDCNIQQVKRLEFDVLYYGLFFADRIAMQFFAGRRNSFRRVLINNCWRWRCRLCGGNLGIITVFFRATSQKVAHEKKQGQNFN